MKKRNFAALGTSSAAAVNAGTIGIQKDKVVYLDPTTEILYDPAENIRNGKVVDDNIERLVSLRLGMDGAEQLQPIRVFPLPADKLDPSRPAMKYGVGYGHRRTLACRLTKKDDERIGEKPRKVAAVIDVDWLSRGRAYRLRCQIQENTNRLDLNPVELGQAILNYQEEASQEEGRRVTQRELMQVFDLREKTIYNLLKAAEFHPIAKDVCHMGLLTDLDTMVTFDAICKQNEELAAAIFASLQVEGAPSNRTLIRQAKLLADDPEYKFDAATWEWPASVEPAAAKPAAPTQHAGVPSNNTTPDAQAQASGDEKNAGAQPGANTQPAPMVDQEKDGAGKPAPLSAVEQAEGNAGASNIKQPATDQQQTAQAQHAAAQPPMQQAKPVGPVVMVTFKMGSEAPQEFSGELVLTKAAKQPSFAVVAYLNDGREDMIEVPLKFIQLLSINHE